MSNIIFYSHPDCLLKENGINHPERKERLETIFKSVNELKEIKIQNKIAPLAELTNINFVHPTEYIKNIFQRHFIKS